MFRRSRFSVRPNVGTTVRTVPTPQEAPPANQEASVAPRETGDNNVATALADKSNVTLTEKAAASGDGSDQNVDGASSSAAVQRRKRFSVKPKVAPGRSSTLSRTTKSPVKAVAQTSVECSGSDPNKPTTSSQTGTTATPKGLQSPRRRRPSEDNKQPKMHHKPTPIALDTSEPSAISPAVHLVEQTHLPADSSKQSENISDRQVKEAPPRPPDRPSLPDKESTELSEKAKTLVTSKSVVSLTPSALSLSRLLNDPSDLQRLVKAQKLRELLREERRKEKKLKKAKSFPKVFSLDPAKMTMSDLIHYLPTSNPMTSSVEDSTQENETVLPPSPGRGVSPEQAQEPEVLPNTVSSREEEEEADEEQEEALMVPQVKVAEDGSLIIDEESLTVEVQRAKGPNPAENRDPIFERGSTTTYSSFRKLNHAKRWTSEETDMFFLAVSMVGTDFSMICQLFPHRARSEIKNKFKKEERENSWRIDKAIRERRKLDIEYFSKLLEKILEYQKSKKKLKSLTEKNSSQKGKRKTEVKKSARKLSDVEEEDEEEDENEVLDLGEDEEEEEGEKENEDLCNDGEIPVSEAKTKRGKRKNKQTALDEEPNDKRNKRVSAEQGEDGIPEDTEAGLHQNHKDSDMSEKTQNGNAAQDTAVKPAKLSQGRAPKPLLPLSCKWSKKHTPCTVAKNTSSDKEEESVNKDASSLSQDRVELAGDDISSEEEDVIVKPPRPTRCGRVPKPIKPLIYPAKEEVHSSACGTTPSSAVGSTASAAKPKSRQTAKRRVSPQPDSAPKSKKSKLVTLTASQTEFSDVEGHQWQDEEVEEVELAGSPSKDSSAPVFVPAGLHTPRPQIKEVDETIAELDILATMPDVLGISHDALCPDSACEQAQHETGSAEPCEHQLDLLIDVIEFISSEHAEEVSEDQSYNEAAQTLLTIGNPTHVPQLGQNQIIIPDHVTGEASACVNETIHLEKELTSEPAVQEKSATPSVSTFGQDVTQTSETVASEKQQDSLTDSGEPNPESSNKNSPQSKRGHFSKVKPKPNLGRISRTAQPKSQSAISPVRTAEESHTVPPNFADCSPALLKSDISSAEVKLPVEPSDSQPDVDGVESGAATSEQSSSEIQSHCSSESQFEPSRDQATTETEPLSEPPDEKLGSPVETSEIGFKDAPNSDSLIAETGQESCTNLPPAKESVDKPPCVSPEVTNTCQSRRSRLQKVKPKPNLPRTSRTVRAKPQTTTQPEERDLIPNPTFHKKATGEPTCTTSEERHQSPDPDSVKPLLDLGSTLTPPEELSTNEEKKSHVGPQQSIQENQNSESQFEHSKQPASNTGSASDFTVEKITSHVGTAKSSCDKVVTTDSAVTASQVGRGANVNLDPVQEGGDHPPEFTTSAEELAVIQKEGEVVSASQLRRTRLPKLKPKPNLPQTSRTARFKPQTSKQPEERDPVPTQDPKFHKQTTMGPQPQSPRTASPEQQSQSADPAAVSKPTLDSDSTRVPGEELSTNEEKNADRGLDLGAVISDCSAPEYQSSESQFELKKDQVTDTKPSSEPTEEKVKSYVGTDNSATSDLAVTEVERESRTDSDRGRESTEKAPPYVSPGEDSPVRQKGGSEVTTTCRSRRSRMQKVKPKPNLVQTSRISRCKPQTTKQAVEKDKSPTQNTKLPETTIADVEPQPACTPSSEKPSENTDPTSGNVVSSLALLEELSANEEKKANVRLDLGAATSDQGAPENQNLYESQAEPSRDTKSSSEPEKNVPCVETAESSCKNVVTRDSADTVSQARKGEDADSGSVQESSVRQAALVTPVEELPLIQEKSEVKSISQLSQIKLKPSLPHTSRAMQSNSKSTKDPVMHSQVEEKSCSQTCVPESTDCQPKDAEAQPSCRPNSPEKSNQFKGPDTDAGSVSEPSVELGSMHKYREELSSTEKEKTDICGPMSSSASSEQNVPQRSRRFPKVRPKPNLGSSTRITRTKLQPADISKPTQHCSVDTVSNIASGQQPGDNNNARKPVKFTEKDVPSGHCSFSAEVCSVLDTANSKDSHPADPDSSLGCLAQVNEQQGEHDHPSNSSQVPVVCVTQESFTQNASSTKDIQSYPIFQDMLPEQVPSDPDEPFFILSLTEIPLSSSGEVVHSANDHPSCFSVAEPSIPQPSSVSGESVAAAGEASLSSVPTPMFTEKKGVMGLTNVKDIEPDPSVFIGHATEKNVAPHESTTDHPPKFPDTVDNNETEMPLRKQRHTNTGRRAKPQVKSSSVRKKQTNKSLSAEAAESAPTDTNTTRDLTHSMPSVEAKPFDAITEPQMGNYSHDEEILTDDKGTNSSLGAQSSQSGGSTCQRKPRDSLSLLPVTNKITPSQSLPPGKPASKRSKVKTPLAEGKQSLLEPVASTSHVIASTLKPLKETHSTSVTLLTQTAVEIKQTADRPDRTPITLQCTDEQSDCMDGSFIEEEPTSVSQYFLSDIFTEVEEG